MLYYKTIHPETLELLKKLQSLDVFKSLRLVGGTALALQIGHRVSDDIDLFGPLKSDKISISEALNEIGKVAVINTTENINVYTVNGIKVDIVNYPYPWLAAEISEKNLRLAALKDISAMKLAAITGRGTKKDFIDIYFLLEIFSLEQILGFYQQKYSDGSQFLVLKSLSYFEDANPDISPKMFSNINWEEIKEVIKIHIYEFENK